ncbi:hypothetical protein Gotur_000720, partial [Gossypium turneri]
LFALLCFSGSNSEGYYWLWNTWYGEVKTETVTKLLEKEGIQWHEENRGTVLIKLDGYRELMRDCEFHSYQQR